ncbi:transmembrane anchor protein [Actimicrobium sp. CCC2.4]|uniref:transmembrane anchor protein n=1 Tax=Actimicrobium sp. CCC2.4 TaxID=3048606 RepID=UPI002AC96EC1|nr:transmembrane anchor protein [Actimicrobium sp. CCC2.4]MEB0134651.1 transmembrane anchor protein [Actimicrobium sp. CCC2.4]WPX30595.1 transmembrane anchor protein [Actimicrobium sp. CCC2.4]
MYNTELPLRAELPSSKKLLRSTGIALVTAAVLLVTVVLPAEYGIDPTGIGRTLGLTAMGQIKVSLAAEASAEAPVTATLPAAPPVAVVAGLVPPVATQPTPVPVAATVVTSRTDETSVTLKPGAAIEVKLAMEKGAKVSYSWKTNGSPVNFDTHGDPSAGPKDAYHGYSKGLQVVSDAGEFTAAFDGNHGWFWRNRANKDVTITLETVGDYKSVN